MTGFAVRIVRGELSDDELAALTAVLMTRAAEPRSIRDHRRPRAHWCRRECRACYRSPVSWR
ncbi:acyl-CoA carboxylase subunit epsilon [Kitasatospora sp. SolWspMP-SS2h]|uniref:acyl-CoA carboxylase subunit epsilon n=1 Tax=Kitasatospora sp. SolWspMP-SS2h TaxID=1305729 RepID=UPI000DBA0714